MLGVILFVAHIQTTKCKSIVTFNCKPSASRRFNADPGSHRSGAINKTPNERKKIAPGAAAAAATDVLVPVQRHPSHKGNPARGSRPVERAIDGRQATLSRISKIDRDSWKPSLKRCRARLSPP
ncbi:hypothetical protein GWI33_013685 [Rhynchophorus ferrugineus]|uniref:Uncharacterized protein n=1 Tax=Rhynchophorus ferrugineus TaxID=354439 RepID=A0A834I6K8_RHYFE|nr:hypothetical protein GWI33_013685 [Rhynchophorus ferrugineus]